MNVDLDRDDAPTATEFLPEGKPHHRRDDEGPGVRLLRATGDGGLEEVNVEPYDDEVQNHVYICDECGHSEDTEDGIAHHLHHEHVLGVYDPTDE